MEPATLRYIELVEHIRRLNRICDNPKHTDVEQAAARREREPLMIETGQLFSDVLAAHQAEAASDPVVVDRGLAVLVAGVLLKIRHELDRELERNDLTPYMWSTLSSKRDALSKVFRMFESRQVKRIDDWVVPEYLLIAEYDDDSIAFEEAVDQAEADQIMGAYVEQGAVVNRYAVYPEFGDKAVLYYPIMPHENRHKPMTQRQYDWVLRRKGAENLALPESLDGLIAHAFSDRNDAVPN